MRSSLNQSRCRIGISAIILALICFGTLEATISTNVYDRYFTTTGKIAAPPTQADRSGPSARSISSFVTPARHHEAVPSEPEELWPAHLPRMTDLKPGQSLEAFMHPEVPSSIRNTALRHIWRTDTSVTSSIGLGESGEANAGDPGFGPIQTSTDMVRAVEEKMARAIAEVLQLTVSKGQYQPPRSSLRLSEPWIGDPRRYPRE